MKIYIAEAYSSGEYTYVPYANMINGPEGWQYYPDDEFEGVWGLYSSKRRTANKKCNLF